MAEITGKSTEQEKGDQPTEAKQRVIDEVGAWVDGDVMASLIAEELANWGIEVTTPKCQDIWLRLCTLIGEQVEAVVERAYEQHPEW